MGHFAAKNVFTILIRMSNVVQLSYLNREKTINHESYIKDCLKHLVFTLQVFVRTWSHEPKKVLRKQEVYRNESFILLARHDS